MSNRDNFSPTVKKTLERRVGARCSAEGCRKPTCGPTKDPKKANNVGMAAHITAAAPGGPRYDASLTAAQRAGIGNGIWLCAGCATKIDGDPEFYTVALLNEWKKAAEAYAVMEFDKPPVSREDYSALEALAFGRLKKSGITDAMARMGRLTASQMEAIDPRFSVDVAYSKGVTSYTYNPKQPVSIGFSVDPSFGDEFAAKYSELAKHGKDLEIDARAITFEGSPLFDFNKDGNGKMVLSTHARKPAILKLSLERKGRRHAIFFDDVPGELVGGAESVTFTGKAFGGVIEISLTCFFEAGDRMKCLMNVSVDTEPWHGKSVRSLPYFNKAFEFYDSVAKGDRIMGQVEIEGNFAIRAVGTFGARPASNPHYRLLRYTRNVRGLLGMLGEDAIFEPAFSATADEVAFVENTYQMVIAQPKVNGKGLSTASITMSMLPNATRHDLDRMQTDPHALRIEHEYAEPLNVFGRSVSLPRLQLTYTKATLRKVGAKEQLQPGKTYRLKICPAKECQFFAGLAAETPPPTNISEP